MSPISVLVPDGGNPNSPFADQRVRQAVEYAIDKKAIATVLGQEYYQPVTQLATPQDSRYVSTLQARNYDPQKAKQLLAEAGYPNGFKTTIYAQNIASQDFLVAVQDNLNAVGINAQLDVSEANRFNSFYKDGWTNGLMVHPSIGANLSGMRTYFGPVGTGPQVYRSAYRPAGWLDQLSAAFAQPDAKKRLAMEQQLIQTISDQAMAIPIMSTPFLAAQNNTVHDLDWGNGGNYVYTPQNAWLSK
jgi:peptide/nickel transport system substrate-binding protein